MSVRMVKVPGVSTSLASQCLFLYRTSVFPVGILHILTLESGYP